MFPTTEVVEIDGKKIICKDLTYGFVLGLRDGTIEETEHAVVMDSTGMSEEEVMKLRRSDVSKIVSIASRLTYPQMYDENGNLKLIDEPLDEDDDKKKA